MSLHDRYTGVGGVVSAPWGRGSVAAEGGTGGPGVGAIRMEADDG
ncbi:hypothetical protein [Natronorarus salvus]